MADLVGKSSVPILGDSARAILDAVLPIIRRILPEAIKAEAAPIIAHLMVGVLKKVDSLFEKLSDLEILSAGASAQSAQTYNGMVAILKVLNEEGFVSEDSMDDLFAAAAELPPGDPEAVKNFIFGGSSIKVSIEESVQTSTDE